VEDPTAPATSSARPPASHLLWRERHERSHATRLALLVAAADQFHSVGYHGASLSEIVTTAGVTKGALYFHFFHKRGVAEAVIAELNATWTAVVTEVAERGLDPLSALFAEVDLVLTHLLEDPIVRGGTRLLHDPALRSEYTHDLAAKQYAYAESIIAAQLHAARQAGMLRPCLDESGCAELARSVMASIVGHHMVCDLTRTEDQLRSRVTAMFHDLLPLITQQH
jgi:AcrR family transcriptional regulator